MGSKSAQLLLFYTTVPRRKFNKQFEKNFQKIKKCQFMLRMFLFKVKAVLIEISISSKNPEKKCLAVFTKI